MKNKTENIVPIYHKDSFVSGSLFCCPDEYIFVFETKHMAKIIANKVGYWQTSSLHRNENESYVKFVADDYQAQYKERVFYTYPGEMLLLIKKGGMHWAETLKNRTFLKILSSRHSGWIVVNSEQKFTIFENK